ncbi:hypothetical protein [Sphaerisporangium dianthi]|uniref:Uncharacterized protein n=1 Tax=Sphaerisporangium dianthi TaxID=1436120 RepID=A0ABV9CJD7_9ACTN
MIKTEMDNPSAFEAAKRMQAKNVIDRSGINPDMIYGELAENITELLSRKGPPPS